jgi:hypothetical protein
MDEEEIPKVVLAFRRVGPAYGNGIILLHKEECAVWVWIPGSNTRQRAESVSIVGIPFKRYGRPQDG